MNGPHDLGGMMGFGPVVHERDEPVFHAEWERRAFAMRVAMGRAGLWTIDEGRHARERTPWVEYLSSSYYENWTASLELFLKERGFLEGVPCKLKRLEAADVASVMSRKTSYVRPTDKPVRFAAGAAVKVRNLQPEGHTRIPAYLRGAHGTVTTHHGAHVYPDTVAHGRGEDPQHLYTVRFRHGDVFGGASQDELHADLFEPYLDRA